MSGNILHKLKILGNTIFVLGKMLDVLNVFILLTINVQYNKRLLKQHPGLFDADASNNVAF